MLVTTASYAKFEVPKDAVIKVFDSKGKQIGEMSRSEYKVVKIGSSVDAGQIIKDHFHMHKEQPKRRLSLLLGLGSGKDGMDVTNNGSNYSIEERDNGVGTIGVCSIKAGHGVCGTISTNKTATLSVLIPLED